jgi:hypothetical protein
VHLLVFTHIGYNNVMIGLRVLTLRDLPLNFRQSICVSTKYWHGCLRSRGVSVHTGSDSESTVRYTFAIRLNTCSENEFETTNWRLVRRKSRRNYTAETNWREDLDTPVLCM